MNTAHAKPSRRFIRSSQGFTMLPLILFLFVIVGLVSAGMLLVGPRVQLGKTVDTKTGLEKAVEAIISWSVANGRIPVATEIQAILPNPNDSWGRPLVYVYEDTLANIINAQYGGLCGRTRTTLLDSGTSLAFALVSEGGDATFQTTVGGTLVTGSAAKSGTMASSQLDLYRPVTLEELKSKAGCYGPTGGRLKIINNELPKACNGRTYSATIFANGGVAPYPTYTITGLPDGLSATGAIISGTPTATGTFNVSVSITDSHPNAVQRIYNLNVVSCGSPPPGSPTNPINFNTPTDPTAVADNWNGGLPGDQGTNNTDAPSGKFDMTVTDGTLSAISISNGTTGSCIWYQRPLTLTGKKMRAYFQYVFESGDGFVFAMVPALGRPTISSCDENAYMGFGSNIPGNTLLGAQFQVNDRNAGTGPGSTCITPYPDSHFPSCTPTIPGINNWTTGRTTYYVRAELDTTITPNPVYKVWMTSDSSYQNVFKNLSTAYSGALPSPISKTLTGTNISDLNSFFLGFTTGQHGHINVNMVASGLKFVLY